MTFKYFELVDDLRYVDEIRDDQTYHSYVRDLLVGMPPALSKNQEYLQSAGAMAEPVFSAYRLKRRIQRLKAKTNIVNPCADLETSAKQLAMEAYHFQERIKLFGDCAIAIVTTPSGVPRLSMEIARVIRAYQKENVRVLRYRNFVVHGPRGRLDEFQALRNSALCAILFHSDLWLNYRGDFEDARRPWVDISTTLLRAMNTALMKIELLNDSLLEHRLLSFAEPQKVDITNIHATLRP
jgi:hypothetical protein